MASKTNVTQQASKNKNLFSNFVIALGTQTCGQATSCSSNPCVMGQCNDVEGTFQCTCDSGYAGLLCDQDETDCIMGSNCFNGKCVHSVDAYECVCQFPFEGRHCTEVIDSCSPDPCINGNCRNGLGDYDCICSSGTLGRRKL